jgi:soluble lytic murein transglycosylase-like protein
MRAIAFLTLMGLSCFAKADIYTSVGENGVEKWSTQSLDPSYTKTAIVEDQPFQIKKFIDEKAIGTKTLAVKRQITDSRRIELLTAISKSANKHGVDPELIEALIAVESGFNTYAISSKGARGLMQLMPETAKRYGMKNEQELHVPAKNIDMGVRHLKDLLNLHQGQVTLAIASYNAGQGAVSKHGQRIPQYRETMIYVPAVLAYIARLSDSGRSAE